MTANDLQKHNETREVIQNRDTVKLGDLADVFTGMMIPQEERKDHGDYLIIEPQKIHGGAVHLESGRKAFCSKDVVVSNRSREKSVLKPGDVLIRTAGDIDWAVYSGDEDFAVANWNVAIIRGKESASEWLKLFFHTNTGIEYLESQLDYYSHCGKVKRISVRDLLDIDVPDAKMMKVTDRLHEERHLEAKVATLFRQLGWDVEQSYASNKNKIIMYDMALFFNQELRGVVEVKSYKYNQVVNNTSVMMQLEAFKRDTGGASVYLFVDDEIYEYNEGVLAQLAELPRPEKRKTEKKTNASHPKATLSIEKKSIDEVSVTDMMLLETVTRDDAIMAALERIESKVDDIAEKIEELSKQITGFQSLVDKQLDMAITPEEEERIIHAFSEECAERIIRDVAEKDVNKEFNDELQKLILTFGESAWGKMDESSRTFLVSSKVMFNKLAGLQDVVDYSGVCLSVTKALEVEIGKRFCKNFIAYLKQKYPGKSNYPLFPTALLNTYGKPIKPKHFTLGTVAYVLCFYQADGLTEDQLNNNKAKLLEYSREKMFSGKTDEEIMAILNDYAESVEEVKNDYRNPSAHTNKLHKVDAEECFALVVDVEKLLKRMLDSFDE